jgi:hypothetical protein
LIFDVLVDDFKDGFIVLYDGVIDVWLNLEFENKKVLNEFLLSNSLKYWLIFIYKISSKKIIKFHFKINKKTKKK